jgi:hypothetical protein
MLGNVFPKHTTEAVSSLPDKSGFYLLLGIAVVFSCALLAQWGIGLAKIPIFE